MFLEPILTVERTKAKLECPSKKRTFEAIAKIFSDNIEQFDMDSLYQNLINREKLGTTGIGGGIAIPHCRFDTVGKTYCACISLQTPIDFDAVDNAPVDIIFAMLVPENAESNHLELLANLAEMLQNTHYIDKLRSSNKNEELFHSALENTG